jgi:nitrogen fixation-related uncharacterized protein
MVTYYLLLGLFGLALAASLLGIGAFAWTMCRAAGQADDDKDAMPDAPWRDPR